MRRNRPAVARAALPSEYSLARTLLASLALSLAVVVGALVLMYPGLSALLVALGVGSWALTAVVLRARLHRRPVRRLAMIRIPFTDLHLEI
ncbi:hypothetical protein [Halosimplex salinum]|uniref:hypothetical protein n=1 Tax=Halosimplex salinum TaxID=1710538 RepID=UPI000F494C23|nr:hypothetical protein [Halosimplex salinum]